MHVELDLHFVRECVAIEDVCVRYVSATSQFADVLTKGLLMPVSEEFRSKLNICYG